MPIWNHHRRRTKPTITSESLNASMEGGFWGDDLDEAENDFVPLIAGQSDDYDEEVVVQEPEKAKEGGSGGKRGLRGSFAKAISFRGHGRNDAMMSPKPSKSSSLMGAGSKSPFTSSPTKTKTFSMPRTSRFSLSRRTLSSKSMSTSNFSSTGANNTASGGYASPTKKKRSYLTKRCDLPEVKERKDDVASALQKYLDVDGDDKEPDLSSVKEASETPAPQTPMRSPKKKTDRRERHRSSPSKTSSSRRGGSHDEKHQSSPSKSGREDKKKTRKDKKRSTKSSSSSSSGAPATPRVSPRKTRTPKTPSTELVFSGMEAAMNPTDEMKASQRSESTSRTARTESSFSDVPKMEALF